MRAMCAARTASRLGIDLRACMRLRCCPRCKRLMSAIGTSGHHTRIPECLLWVISGHLQCKTACPLYSQKRTSNGGARMSATCHKRTIKGLRSNPINQRWIVIPRVSSAQVSGLLDGAAGYTGDEAVEEQIIGDRHRDAGDQCAGHDLAPIKDVAADEIGRHAEGDRFLVRR